MPLLRGCCSLDLQIGTKIIGVICLIFGIIGFIATGITCATIAIMKEVIADGIKKAFPPDDGTINITNGKNDGNSFLQEENDSMVEGFHYLANHLHIILIVFLIIFAQQFLEILVNSCLIHGIRKNRRGLLMPWIVMHILYIFIELGLIVLFITVIAYINGLYNVMLPMIAIDLCWMAIHVYFILVVISQYQALGLIRMHNEMSMKP